VEGGAAKPHRTRTPPEPPAIPPLSPGLARPEQRPDAPELFFSSSGRLSRLPFLAGEGAVLALLWLYDCWITGWLRGLTGWAVLFALLFSGCCLVSRRLHDLGRAGWWTFLYFGLFLWSWPHPRSWPAAVLAILALELALRPGQARANRFGPALGRQGP
jgi:uncharacterized membrane protein YhaH (DUF805 family)